MGHDADWADWDVAHVACEEILSRAVTQSNGSR